MHKLLFGCSFVISAAALLSFGGGIQQISSPIRSELAPAGKLRAGINFGNALLASRDAGETPKGIAVDLAQELSRRTGLPLEIVGYDSAGRMADEVKSGTWDVAFLGSDPDRAEEITFTAPYLEIDTTYLVPPGSRIKTLADVDVDGVRIAVSAKSAYDLSLTRGLKRATLMRAPSVDASVDLFFSERLEALAGLRPLLVEVSEKHPGTRVLDGQFAVVQQAVAAPKRRVLSSRYLREFIEEVKASGLVAKIIEKNGIRGVSVSPAALKP